MESEETTQAPMTTGLDPQQPQSQGQLLALLPALGQFQFLHGLAYFRQQLALLSIPLVSH